MILQLISKFKSEEIGNKWMDINNSNLIVFFVELLKEKWNVDKKDRFVRQFN